MDTLDDQEQKLDKIVEHTRIETGISGMAEELRAEILNDINSRIDGSPKTKIAFLRTLSIAASVAVVLLVGSYIVLNINNYTSQEKQMMAQLESVSQTGECTEVCIISGEIRETIAANEEIEHTKEGNILIGGIQKIQADDLKEDYISIVVPKGKRASVLLCENTKIQINSGSSLVYPKTFKGKSRQVYLEGEIYLEVSPDKRMPFSVHTEKMNVNVLGTKFNVNAYKGASVNHVVLAEGSVDVEGGNDTNRLTPGQGYFLRDDTEQVKQVDVYAYTCWKEGRIKLVDGPFEMLIRKISHYYGVEIVADTTLNSIRFDGNMNLMDSAEELISTLSLSYNFSYRKTGNVIEIISNRMSTE